MAGYTRQSSAEIVNSEIINASDFNNEYDQIEAAFNASTGHAHDGTAAEGAPITKVGPAQDLIVSASSVLPKTDNTLDLGSGTFGFKDGYFDGAVSVGTLTATTSVSTAALTATGTITFTGATVANGGTVTTVDINGGSVDGTTVGAASASTGAFTTLSASGATTLTSTLAVTGAATFSSTVIAPAAVENNQTGTTYTLVLSDAGKAVNCANASAITLTVPPNSSVAFAVGTIILVEQDGAGQITFTAGSGVTINNRQSHTKSAGQYAVCGLKKTATDTWTLYGDTAA